MFTLPAFDRRSLMQRALLLAGARLAMGGAALHALPAPTHEALPPALGPLLISFADTVIPSTDTPGAVDAGVPRAFDALMVRWATPETRAQITGALQALDSAALASTNSGFQSLAPKMRESFLTEYDVKMFADPAYARLKDLIVTLYYMSEPGSTVELRYEQVPGAWEPSIPVTAATRSWGGVLPI